MAEFRAVGEIVYVEGRVVFSEDGLPYGVVGVNFPTDDEGTILTIPEQFVKPGDDLDYEDWGDEDWEYYADHQYDDYDEQENI